MNTADIIIFGGQSNMQGQTEGCGDQTPVANAYEYRWLSNAYIPLKNPVGEHILYDGTAGYSSNEKPDKKVEDWLAEHCLGGASQGCSNLVPAFCRAYEQETGITTLAVHTAKGSTTIADWIPGSPGFRMLVDKAKAAIQKAAEEFAVGKVFFTWLQGESDALESNTKAYYKGKLEELMQALKAELDVDKFGMIRVGLFTRDAADWEIINAQSEICAENEDFLMLTELAVELIDIPQYVNPKAPGHFSIEGLNRLGSDAGSALGRYRRSI